MRDPIPEAAGVDGIESYDVPRRVKSDDLLLTALQDDVRFDGAGAHRIDVVEVLVGAKQMIAPMQDPWRDRNILTRPRVFCPGQAPSLECALQAGGLSGSDGYYSCAALHHPIPLYDDSCKRVSESWGGPGIRDSP